MEKQKQNVKDKHQSEHHLPQVLKTWQRENLDILEKHFNLARNNAFRFPSKARQSTVRDVNLNDLFSFSFSFFFCILY